MLIYKNGDILKAPEEVICHQVNVDGFMGGGLALQIAKLYPEVEKSYKNHCRAYGYDYKYLKGNAFMVRTNDGKIIENCFTQDDFVTDYIALKTCFGKIIRMCDKYNYHIAVPYKYGCGIAKGSWDIVERTLERLSNYYGVDITIYKLEEEK